MKSFASAGDASTFLKALDGACAIDPTVVFLFAAPAFMRGESFLRAVREKLSGRAVIGCSSSGEVSAQGLKCGGFSLLAVRFERTAVRMAHAPMPRLEDSFTAGQTLGQTLLADDLKAVFVLGAGTNVNGSAIIDGIVSVVGQNVSISGGLAGDEMDFKETHTLCNNEMFNDQAVAVGLYGAHVVVSCGSEGGWRPFGPARRVTKAEGNILYELDGKPALQLYKHYLGDKARNLPASGLDYPFAVLRGDRSTSGIIRTALNIDHEKESLILAGDIPQNCQVCLMHADTVALVQGAAQAAAEALRTHANGEENGCALVVSCAGRKITLGIDVDDEIEAVTDSFLPGTPIAGYYSYGEICSYAGTGRVELHNQTMTITYITEKVGGDAAIA